MLMVIYKVKLGRVCFEFQDKDRICLILLGKVGTSVGKLGEEKEKQ